MCESCGYPTDNLVNDFCVYPWKLRTKTTFMDTNVNFNNSYKILQKVCMHFCTSPFRYLITVDFLLSMGLHYSALPNTLSLLKLVLCIQVKSVFDKQVSRVQR